MNEDNFHQVEVKKLQQFNEKLDKGKWQQFVVFWFFNLEGEDAVKEESKILEKLENDQKHIMQKVSWREMRRQQMLKGIKNYSVSLQEQYDDYDRIIGSFGSYFRKLY